MNRWFRNFLLAVAAADRTLNWASIGTLKEAVMASLTTTDREGQVGSQDDYNLAASWARSPHEWGPWSASVINGGCGYGSRIRAYPPLAFSVTSCGGHEVAVVVTATGAVTFTTDRNPSRSSWGDAKKFPRGGPKALSSRVARLEKAFRILDKEAPQEAGAFLEWWWSRGEPPQATEEKAFEDLD